jgi:formate hydrogenlyase subunit 3/multisubunit Na+/H+ antiporter MnhD subunit
VPLLASFPFRWPLLQELAGSHLDAAILIWFGSIGLAVSGFRTLSVLVEKDSDSESESPRGQQLSRISVVSLIMGSVILLIIGIRPDLFNWLLIRLPTMFPQIFGIN